MLTHKRCGSSYENVYVCRLQVFSTTYRKNDRVNKSISLLNGVSWKLGWRKLTLFFFEAIALSCFYRLKTHQPDTSVIIGLSTLNPLLLQNLFRILPAATPTAFLIAWMGLGAFFCRQKAYPSQQTLEKKITQTSITLGSHLKCYFLLDYRFLTLTSISDDIIPQDFLNILFLY